AHQLGRAWRGMMEELQRLADHRVQDLADALHDETALAPRRAELEPWFEAVDRVRDGVEALELRIMRLTGGQR
ncbi:MAG: hypothetical protein K6346_02550, partial [Halothiobacillaceae bacterium]